MNQTASGATPHRRAIRVTSADNVATLVETAEAGESVVVVTGDQTEQLVAVERIAANFKIALTALGPGEAVRKYGEVIGEATTAIPRGGLVHRHNLVGRRGRGDQATRREDQ